MVDQDAGALSNRITLTKAEAENWTPEQRDVWKAGLDAWVRTWVIRGYTIRTFTEEGPGNVVWIAEPKR